jgi:hypothetical protein
MILFLAIFHFEYEINFSFRHSNFLQYLIVGKLITIYQIDSRIDYLRLFLKAKNVHYL